MRLRHIEIFHEVYRNGSITAAAKALNISQPSVSKVLMHAETQLGFPLFKRTAGRLVATDEAHTLFEEVSAVFDRLEMVRQVARNLRTGEGGHIRLAVVPALALDIAPVAIAGFRAQHPGVTFGVQVLHHDEVSRALLTREADLAVAYDPAEHPLLETFKVGSGEIMALARPGEFAAHADRLDIAELAEHPYIGSVDTGPVSDTLHAALTRQNLVLNEVVSVDAYFTAVEIVRRGGGVALVDEYTALARFTEGLVAHRLAPALAFGVYCVHMADRPLSKIARSFLAAFKKEMRKARSAHSLPA
jgi:DNA-binding transcriptional LysR family regulator